MGHDIRELNFSACQALPHPCSIEVYTSSEIMSCSTAQITQTSYRYGCYMLVWVTQGKSQQWLDFKMMQAAAGTLIVVKPGQQVHCFGSDTDWQGWVMLFQPEALKRAVSSEIDIEQLPSISHYSDETVSVFTQITQDSL